MSVYISEEISETSDDLPAVWPLSSGHHLYLKPTNAKSEREWEREKQCVEQVIDSRRHMGIRTHTM